MRRRIRRVHGVKSATHVARADRESEMGRYELPELEMAVAGAAPMGGEALFALGMMYSSGNSVPVDLVSAHKWFNLAAMNGYADAARLRREIAAEMTRCRDRQGPARCPRVAEVASETAAAEACVGAGPLSVAA